MDRTHPRLTYASRSSSEGPSGSRAFTASLYSESAFSRYVSDELRMP